MTYVSVLSERAYREWLEAWEWYEEKQQGLGDRFKEQVLIALAFLKRIH